MEPGQPLRELFATMAEGSGGTAATAAELMAASGHAGLPEDLLAEAITSYADTAPAPVAEHLSGYVMAHSAVPGLPPVGAEDVAQSSDADWGLAALASAPPTTEMDSDGEPGFPPESASQIDDLDPGVDDGIDLPPHAEQTLAADELPESDADAAGSLDFGHGDHHETAWEADEEPGTALASGPGPAPVEPSTEQPDPAGGAEGPEISGGPEWPLIDYLPPSDHLDPSPEAPDDL